LADPSDRAPEITAAKDATSPPVEGPELSDTDLTAIAETIEKGEDPYELPPEATREIAEKDRKASVSSLIRKETEKGDKRSVYSLVKDMNVGERIKLAMKGNRQARNVLLNDRVRMVRRYVLSNPRITDEELLALAKNRSIDLNLLEIISGNSEWVKKYTLRLALVTNPKTPVATALRLLASLDFRDLRRLAKSRNVPSVVNSVAKRYVLRHQKSGA